MSAHLEDDEPLYDPDDMMKLLKLNTKKHLYKLIERGQAPPSIRIGRSVRFVPRDYREWLESRKG
jgi:predicted DNA-binding transcriptional regulator AlpA